jgi:ribosomal protein L5
MEKLKYPMGLNLTIVTSAQTDAEAKELLTLMEVPFAR